MIRRQQQKDKSLFNISTCKTHSLELRRKEKQSKGSLSNLKYKTPWTHSIQSSSSILGKTLIGKIDSLVFFWSSVSSASWSVAIFSNCCQGLHRRQFAYLLVVPLWSKWITALPSVLRLTARVAKCQLLYTRCKTFKSNFIPFIYCANHTKRKPSS